MVNGHTVSAACTRPLPVPPASQLYHAPQHPAHHPTTAHYPLPANPSPYPILLAGSRAHRVRLVPSCQWHPPRRRHWVQRARHPCGLDRRRPKARRRQGSDDRAGFLVLQVPMLRWVIQVWQNGRHHRKPRVRPLRTCARLHRTTPPLAAYQPYCVPPPSCHRSPRSLAATACPRCAADRWVLTDCAAHPEARCVAT